MFIAMNRFRIVKGKEAEFERIWAERDSHLDGIPGFEEFGDGRMLGTVYYFFDAFILSLRMAPWPGCTCRFPRAAA